VPGADTTWHWAERQPMASYLAMVAIGDYRVRTSTHNGLPVVTAVDASLPTFIDAVVARTPEIIDFLATQFGPYPFDAEGGIVQSDPAVRSALENQSRPVYSAGFFQAGASAVANTSVLAHELAHQWFGDSVTVADWSDLWLNEGFATYAQWLWLQHSGGMSPKATFDALYRGRSFPVGAPAVRTPATEFDDAVYDRGAATLEALRISVGDAMFFRIIQAWAAQRKYGNGSTAQFIGLAESMSGKALGPMFTAWLYTPGRPPYPKAIG
jgi:aminopeptidase N